MSVRSVEKVLSRLIKSGKLNKEWLFKCTREIEGAEGAEMLEHWVPGHVVESHIADSDWTVDVNNPIPHPVHGKKDPEAYVGFLKAVGDTEALAKFQAELKKAS